MNELAQNDEWITGNAIVQDPTGLHARPAVKLTKLAKTFSSKIEIRADDSEIWTNAKSPNAVMKLKAGHGLPLHIRASGEDAKAAIDALVALIDRNFSD